MTTKINFYGATDVGKVRQNNEDAFIAQKLSEDCILVGAIDGMGGEEGGEVATDIFLKSVTNYLNDFHNDSPINLLKRAFTEGNNNIIRHKEAMPRYSKMGCVATIGILNIKEHTLSIAHVGDSRLYRFSNGELKKLTHDHSRVGFQEEQGILSETEAMAHPRRSVIDKCIGYDYIPYGDDSFIESGVFPITNGDKYLFCSDGLSDVLTSSQIRECLMENLPPKDECLLLIKRANDAGGKDNITVVIANIEEPSETDEGTGVLIKKTDYISTQEISQEDNEEETNDTNEKLNKNQWYCTSKKFVTFLVLTGLLCFGLGFFTGFSLFQGLNIHEESIETPLNPVQSINSTDERKVEPAETIPSLNSENIEIKAESSEDSDSI